LPGAAGWVGHCWEGKKQQQGQQQAHSSQANHQALCVLRSPGFACKKRQVSTLSVDLSNQHQQQTKDICAHHTPLFLPPLSCQDLETNRFFSQGKT
jgi:hypothetical protein